ncbi:MAG: Gfo/Idh/MocA family oxidoreductase [Gammaproteobacteria bacterium]|nr:Gfo/Idh/MocA family oxidoreductase [Gammaproteobacteria bacterium]
MYKVKIHGAGSIGNHLANACRVLGWEVHICDLDRAALDRTRNQIYPQRYGSWDESIKLFPSNEAPKGGYDLIFIGTPPNSHLDLAMQALQEKPKALLVEKPLCPPDLTRTQELYSAARAGGTRVFVGYNHVVAPSVVKLEEILRQQAIGPIETLDVEFREHWGGIFAAHPWLSGPADTYLGFWTKGGGASGEHSHALNLWQHFAHVVGAGCVVEVSAMMDFVSEGGADYDKVCAFDLRTESGLMGRCVQDVVTAPARKWGRIQGRDGFGEFHINHKPGLDMIVHKHGKADAVEAGFSKTRPDDFIVEMKHIADVLSGKRSDSPVSIERGLETMLALVAAHRSAREGRVVRIDYSKGYGPAAIS